MENTDFLTFFRSEYWNELSDEQKMVQLQDLENLMAEKQGRAARTVINNPELDGMGAYDSWNSDKLEINLSNNPTSYDCMDTIIHEGRHATQDDCLSGKNYNQDCFSEDEIESLKNNSEKHGGIYRSTEDGDSEVDYYFQPKEYDANTDARNTMDGLSEHFQDDPEFENYQNRRNKDYDNKIEEANRQYSGAAENGQSITDCIDEKNRADLAKNEERRKSNGGDVMLKQDVSPDMSSENLNELGSTVLESGTTSNPYVKGAEIVAEQVADQGNTGQDSKEPNQKETEKQDVPEKNNDSQDKSNTPEKSNNPEYNNELEQDDDYYYGMGM